MMDSSEGNGGNGDEIGRVMNWTLEVKRVTKAQFSRVKLYFCLLLVLDTQNPNQICDCSQFLGLLQV